MHSVLVFISVCDLHYGEDAKCLTKSILTGELVEYEEPAKLMEDTDSSFAKLVAEYWSTTRA